MARVAALAVPMRSLMSIPPREWVVGQVVVFDWFDGPRAGVARMLRPECEFAFELLDERPRSDDLDDRLFRVSELPAGSVAMILDAIRCLGSPASLVWVPAWTFPSEEERQRADEEIEHILSAKKRTGTGDLFARHDHFSCLLARERS
jgi:hypothetical protein